MNPRPWLYESPALPLSYNGTLYEAGAQPILSLGVGQHSGYSCGMDSLLHHPAFASLAFCLLGTWPIIRVLRRAGLSGGWTGLLWLNLILPGLGLALVAGVLCHRPWPHVPKPAPKWVKTKIWGEG